MYGKKISMKAKFLGENGRQVSDRPEQSRKNKSTIKKGNLGSFFVCS